MITQTMFSFPEMIQTEGLSLLKYAEGMTKTSIRLLNADQKG